MPDRVVGEGEIDPDAVGGHTAPAIRQVPEEGKEAILHASKLRDRLVSTGVADLSIACASKRPPSRGQRREAARTRSSSSASTAVPGTEIVANAGKER